MFGALLALDATLIAWLAQHYTGTSPLTLAAGLFGTVALTSAIIWIVRAAYRRIEELEDL